jgi:hypothetical protein
MARASYQRIDNIRIGNKPVRVKLVKKNHKTVTVCPTPSQLDTPPLRVVREDTPERPYRPMLRLKV